MPGYAIEPNTAKPILVFEPDTIDELYERAFYGIKYNANTGKAYMEVVSEDEPIKLPQSGTIGNDDYAHWFASSKQINLTWRDEDPGHLYLEVT